MMDNKPEILWLFFAVANVGGVCVPVNTAAKGELLVYYLTQSDSVVLISDVELLPRFGRSRRSARRLPRQSSWTRRALSTAP